MGAAAAGGAPWSRRRAAALVALAAVLALSPAVAVGQAPVLIVARKRVLNETDHAKALMRAEIELTTELQRQVDVVKAELTKEEQELAALRATLNRETFEERVAAFDRRVRSERRRTQQRAAALESAFREERLKLVEALDPVLAAVRNAHRAGLILNSDQVLAADPALDVTDEVIDRFNATVPPPTVPTLEALEIPADGDRAAP